jgi:hypothetical protein
MVQGHKWDPEHPGPRRLRINLYGNLIGLYVRVDPVDRSRGLQQDGPISRDDAVSAQGIYPHLSLMPLLSVSCYARALTRPGMAGDIMGVRVNASPRMLHELCKAFLCVSVLSMALAV